MDLTLVFRLLLAVFGTSSWSASAGTCSGSSNDDSACDDSSMLQVPARGDVASAPKCTDADKKLYIFGYGSLMLQTSSMKTDCNITDLTPWSLGTLIAFFKGHANLRRCRLKQPVLIPVEASGISRGWYAHGLLQSQEIFNWSAARMRRQYLDIRPTYLGAVNKSGTRTTGVIYRVTEAELNATDKRETGSQGVQYTKAWLQPADIKVLGAHSVNLNCAKIRWYAMAWRDVKFPDAQFPIAQYYVDEFVGGALQVEQENNVPGFALSSVMMTSAWSTHWINDRIVAYRAYEMNHLATNITRVLLRATQEPRSPLTMEQFQHIKLVGAPGTQT
eukprot:TRINITY_DN24264_c0_g1_i1.p1 TRINITY_DN24264_c0_g1~~TRINITY_DN24264_c0_g1_i1.p1  ORF type:complete len:332 (+),score=54.38 TRINITY_DN24264_c0_g1_i1:54-1049(+)